MVPLGILLGLSSAVAFGLLDSLISIASRYISIVQTIVLAQAISVLVLLFYLVIFFKSAAIFSPADLPLLLFVGGGLGIINTLANLSLYRGLALGPVAIISPIAASYGLVTTSLAVFVYHDVLSMLQWLVSLWRRMESWWHRRNSPAPAGFPRCSSPARASATSPT